MQGWTRCAIVMALVTALVLPPSAAHATFPGKNGRFAFSRWREPKVALMTSNPDGTGVRRLTFAGSFESPSWSADGRRLVYVRGSITFSPFTLGVMRADGSGRRRVPFYESGELSSPSFSPAGRRIIVTRSANGRCRIWTLRPDGSDRKMLLRGLEGDMAGGVYAPDGNSIAFSYAPPNAAYASIYTVRTDGTGLRRLTRGHRDSNPDWAPGGRRLVFNRMSDDFRRVNLVVINRGGANLDAITDVRPSMYADDPVWSPDGRWILYHQLTEQQVLRVIRPDGTDGRRAVFGSDHNLMPSWQPLPR